jgi:transcriptional regulator with XRE-family HTH domain
MEPIYAEFGKLLRLARKRAELTQEALAKRVELSRTSITNIERGNQPVALHTFVSLAKAVGVPAGDLLPADTTDTELTFSDLSKSQRRTVHRELDGAGNEDRNRIIRILTSREQSNGNSVES